MGKCSAALVYSPGEDWPDRADTQGLKAIACHAYWGKAAAWSRGKGIGLTDFPGLYRTVAEHTLALMMSAARNIPQADAAVRRGEWKDHVELKARYSGFDFRKRRLVILGMGQIGIQLAAAGF
jgi:phosphoglycerate dehydrogenase-like enzyme